METLPTPPPVAPRNNTRRMVAAGLLILLSGILIGGAIGFRAARLRDPLTLFDPESVSYRISRLMKFQLGLSEEQRAQVEQIFEEHRAEAEVVRRKILPEVEPIMESLRTEVESILSPDQAERWNAKFHEIRDKWRPKPAPESAQ